MVNLLSFLLPHQSQATSHKSLFFCLPIYLSALRFPLYAFPVPLPDLIARLRLSPHPEGGYFRETHRSSVTIPRAALPHGYPADRVASTSILFLLPTGVRSRWHRVRSEEIWIHQQGDPLQLRIAPPGGTALPSRDLPSDPSPGGASLQTGAPSDLSPTHTFTLAQSEGHALQAVVPPNHWQDALALSGPHGYALAACVVAPGFDFQDFEILD